MISQQIRRGLIGSIALIFGGLAGCQKPTVLPPISSLDALKIEKIYITGHLQSPALQQEVFTTPEDIQFVVRNLNLSKSEKCLNIEASFSLDFQVLQNGESTTVLRLVLNKEKVRMWTTPNSASQHWILKNSKLFDYLNRKTYGHTAD
jgi:hypothetical protein